MKAFLLSVIVAATFSWGSQFMPASAGETGVVTATVESSGGGPVLVVRAQVGDDKAPCKLGDTTKCLKLIASGESDKNGMHMVRVLEGSPVASGAAWFSGPDDGTRVSLTALDDANVDENTGWLGVQLGSMKVEGDANATEGIAILNIAKGSPAAAAGFERDDLLVEIDDVAVGDDLGAMVDLVRKAVAGERMKFTVVRDGARRTLVATLGRRADAKEVEWEYDTGVGFQTLDRLNSRVKVLREGEDGEWKFLTVDGDIDIVLPENIGDLMPGMHSRTMTFFAHDDGERHISIDVVRDGEGLSIETTDDGQIRVTRSVADSGEETVTVYADADELAAKDADAFEIFDGAGNQEIAPFGTRAFSITLGASDDDPTVWVQDIEANIAEQSDALAEAMEQLKNIRVEVIADGENTNTPGAGTFMGFLHRNKAAQTIRENPDGTIDVIVRKGDNELVTRYADEADLESRNATAYETFVELKSASGGE